MADLQSSWHVEITSIGPGGYVFYYEDNVEPIKCWWDYSVTIAQIDLPAAASWDSTYPRARACYALWISWFRTAHDGLILAKHSALKAIPLAIFINIHSVKRYFDLS